MTAPSETVLLPKAWPKLVRSAILYVIGLAHMALTYSRSWAADSSLGRVCLQAALDVAQSEIALLTEELRIKDSRLGRLSPYERPHYSPQERLAILELRAARGWSAAETGRRMLVEQKTIASWMKRVDQEGPEALVQTPEPVNRFPDFVRHAVTSLKRLCPAMGKRRIAQILARAGLHLAATTVKRMLAAPCSTTPAPPSMVASEPNPSKSVIARYPNHLWQVDLTLLPRVAGLWAPWFPSALPQRWPFVWWVAVVVDHFSRRVVGWCLFPEQSTSVELRTFLGRSMHVTGAIPRYLVSDKGSQFACSGYRDWCNRKGTKPRYAAADSIRATAIVERFFRSFKTEMKCLVGTVLTRKALQQKLAMYFQWFAEHRPHQGLAGRTPHEVCGRRATIRAATEMAEEIELRPSARAAQEASR